MRVTLFQMSVDPENVQANIEKIEASIDGSTADFLVFPEACTSGFPYRRLKEVARANHAFLDSVLARQKASGDNRTLLLPLLIEQGGQFFNRQFIVSRGQVQVTYDKIHLIGLLGEDRFLAAGERAASTDIHEFHAGLATCYDLRFPEIFRKLIPMGVNLFVIPAMWPVERASHLGALARARAIENLSYVIVCNATGQCGSLSLCGHSMIVDPKGEIVAEAAEEVTTLTANLSLEVVKSWRAAFPALDDMRML
ncbi:MAG: hypothetical protein JNM27_02370 [Leptospirales bacterium]|nr:hypothetical protein [Leptospirales bacterium]